MADRPIVIPFYALRLGNLVSAKARLIITCRACHRSADVEVVPLLHRLGPQFGVKDTERVLSCTGCRQKGWAMVRVEWL